MMPGTIMADEGWQRKFDDPVTLPGDGARTVCR